MRRFLRLLLPLVAALAMGVVVSDYCFAGPIQRRNHLIKSMPLLDRPYRVGHVYGNTVRRRHYRQLRICGCTHDRCGNRIPVVFPTGVGFWYFFVDAGC